MVLWKILVTSSWATKQDRFVWFYLSRFTSTWVFCQHFHSNKARSRAAQGHVGMTSFVYSSHSPRRRSTFKFWTCATHPIEEPVLYSLSACSKIVITEHWWCIATVRFAHFTASLCNERTSPKGSEGLVVMWQLAYFCRICSAEDLCKLKISFFLFLTVFAEPINRSLLFYSAVCSEQVGSP